MNFEIDVSGEDILNKDYTICVTNNKIIKGFKISAELAESISTNYRHGAYRYGTSKKDKSQLKIRTYCIIIYYIFKSIPLKDKNLSLKLCKDFDGKEPDIETNLRYFLCERLGFKLEKINFGQLDSSSDADKYAGLMRKDTKNQLKTYVSISLSDIEQFLKKK